MAEVTRRRQGEMLQTVFEVLSDQPDGLPAKAVLHQAEDLLPPTEFESADYPDRPGVRRYEKLIRFSTINAVKAGWLVKSKGIWVVTDEGAEALKKFPDPEAFMKESVRLYQIWKSSQPVEESGGDSPDELDHPHPSITLEEAEETARQEIYDFLSKMPPYEFQDLVAALLAAMGYHISWIAPPGPDKGIDLVAYNDPLGAIGPRIKVQVKRRADKIAVQEVRSFVAVLSDKDVGIFVSTGGFTSDAHAEVRHQENRRVTLIGIEDLFDLWVEHYEVMPESGKQLLPLKPIYYLAPG